MDEALKVSSSAFVTCCETAKVLHVTEAALDAIAVDVSGFIMLDDDLSRSVRGDDSFGSHGRDDCAQGVAVIGLIGQNGLGCVSIQERRCLCDVADLAHRYDKSQRSAHRIGQHVNLDGQSTSGSPSV